MTFLSKLLMTLLSKLSMKFLSNVIIVRLAFYVDADPDPAILVQIYCYHYVLLFTGGVHTTVYTAAIYPPKWLTMGSHTLLYRSPDD
jgi:hypothetical protein